MPTRKQRRRREKERRHDYEFVYVDEEGREVEVEPDDAKAKAPERKDKRPAATTRGGRVVQPASWQRVARRAAIFAPLMFLTIRLLERTEPLVASIGRTIFLLVIFLPFSYVMDAILYRSYQRRIGAGRQKG